MRHSITVHIFNYLKMKNVLNFSTDQLNSSLRRDPSLKSSTLLRLGLTVNSFHADYKQRKKHTRMKTDQYIPQHTPSIASIFYDNKTKVTQRERQSKKSYTDVQLKKTQSFKTLSHTNNVKSSIKYKSNYSSKQNRHDNHMVKSLQKLRKDIHKANPQSISEELKNITQMDKKNGMEATVINECYLLSNDLVEMIKNIKKKYSIEMNAQKETFQKRQQKLVRKIMEMEKKNQRCSALINQLRMRNIDVDGIWHEQKINSKFSQLGNK